MLQTIIPRRYFSPADVLVIVLIGAGIYGVVSIAEQWSASFQPVTHIDLSIWALPRYSLFSAMRGLAAYILSLLFTLVVGFAAAKSKKAERVIIPTIDILQSVPVLAFLPGLVLGLIALFPKTNIGFELAAIISIFTSQVWNMTFAFYSSLKSVPTEYIEASTIIGLDWKKKLTNLELPFSAVNLAWNSLMSMAGGWFFLITCESFQLGEREFQLPGIGAYMAVAIKEDNTAAKVYGIVAMILVIVILDFMIWHPVLAWVRRFRLEEVPGAGVTEPFMMLVLKDSRFIRWMRFLYRRTRKRTKKRKKKSTATSSPVPIGRLSRPIVAQTQKIWGRSLTYFEPVAWTALVTVLIWVSVKFGQLVMTVPIDTWTGLFRNMIFTFLRVIGALALSTLWALPVGIWIGLSPQRTRMAQPIIQVLASFPAPMLYPLVLGLLLAMGMSFGVASMFLIFIGVQWYVLFNVLAGALKISAELDMTLQLAQSSRWDRWKYLYIPSVFPALVTGWVTAAGGAWNASIVSEYLVYKGKVLTADGLGASIQTAVEKGDFHLLAAGLTLMVAIVLSINRLVWARIYNLAQTVFRMDM